MGPPSPLPPLQGAFPHCRSSRGSPSNHGAPEPENGPHGAGAGGGSAPWGAGAGVSTPRRAPQALTRALSSSPDDPEGAFVPPEFDVTGNTFEVSGRRPGGQCGKGCREPAQPAPGRDHGCQGTRLPRLRVDSRRSCSKHWRLLRRGRNGRSPAEAARRGRCGSVGGSQAGWRWRPRGRRGPWAPLRALPRGSLTRDVPRGQAARPPAWQGCREDTLPLGCVPGAGQALARSGQWPPSALYPLTELAGSQGTAARGGPRVGPAGRREGAAPPPRMDGTVPLRGHLSCGGGAPSLWARLGAGCTRLCPREGASPPPPSWGGGVCFLSCSASHGLTVAPPTGEEGLLRAPTRVQVRPRPGLRGLCSAPGQPRSGTHPQGLADPWAVRVLHCGAVTPVWHPSCPCLGTEWHSCSWQSQLLCR